VTLNDSQMRALEKIEASPAPYVIGIDEVGMGSWAGPVVVAGVVLPKGWKHKDIKDSKKLSPKRRELAFQLVTQHSLARVVLWSNNQEIDRHGIRTVRDWLTEGAALYCLRRYPDALIVQDGDVPVVIGGIPQNMVWLSKADVFVPAVSAASCLAKVSRDAYMRQVHDTYPHYGWDTNMGYGTQAHSEGLLEHGACPLHRMRYKPVIRLNAEHARSK
jgi:ribonuclease HII